ncbi:hypothetical protein COX93_00160 [Candidatus Nomurabacteria bacterium CG_4_10_14_0_2_um_filter_30_12]|uniref:Uncharacterized protein n=2 Tax=Candidatus Nomuraibacteriota TaxID=1752729 RepID=A0A2J0MGM9_9BACT|nr:MAG: hypothetical protein COU48_02185 [Candidatus Nomurabacteria bacterium CG10_big_fil_rev_8_21_14_0_10_03_31_7]PIZ87732.1 MAG: hypothetical protein COX93_00160 [Candidatus Nomurabacteria bacterium CG_4_10_14_0_2_um_filter_30_12]
MKIGQYNPDAYGIKSSTDKSVFIPEKSLQEKIKKSGLKEVIEPFVSFSCGQLDQSKHESNPRYSKELEYENFKLDGKKVDIYRIKKDGKPLHEIYIHLKG